MTSLVSRFRSHESLRLENMALRHQLAVYQRTVKRPKLRPADRLFWAWLSRLWPGWQQALAFVQPRTVMAWQKQRFRNDWRRLSQSGKPGRPAISKDVCELIQDMWRSNPTWGSPRIVGELRKIGIDVAKSTVEKYRPRTRKPSSPTWKAFLNNHVKDIVACDCFTVPTATFKVLFVFVILAHERRRLVHFHITEPHGPVDYPADRRRLSLGHSAAFQSRAENLGIDEVKIAPRSPWQNPYCERVIGSIRRDALDHVIVLNEQHLKRVLQSYFAYSHDWRTHRSLEMDAPTLRPVQGPELGAVRKVAEVGGLHHHYDRQAA